MYFARISEDLIEQQALPLDMIEAEMRGLTGNLDTRFVEAGAVLGNAYDIVERLIARLDGVINALGAEAADGAMARMQQTASRLMRLPERQRERAQAFGTIREMSAAIRQQARKVNRLLSFLRICGLNIRIAAAGAQDFADFAEIIFARIDQGEEQMSQVSHTTERLHAGMADVLEVEQRLAGECRQVIPAVPMQLDADAEALRGHQQESGRRAAQSAEMARTIRAHVAAAIGAIQIGDITRQRLEHVTDGIRALQAFLDARPETGAEAAETIRGHVLALLAAQAMDAVDDLQRESRTLTQSMRAIQPAVSSLLDLGGADTAGGGGQESAALFETLEHDIGRMSKLTRQLHAADALSNRLGNDASATAADLAERARHIHRITNDVQQMAWNTDLRCHRMGDEGRGLAAVASEIRDLANQLEAISGGISHLFDRLGDAAEAIHAAPGDQEDAGSALAESLACIREGNVRLRAGLASLRDDAENVARVLDGTERKVDCEELSAALGTLAAQLGQFGSPCDPAREDIAPLLGELLGAIAATYTMVREREVHRPFAGETGDAAPVIADDDDFDDGLF